VEQLRFEKSLGTYLATVEPESIWISRGLGTHCVRAQLALANPEVVADAGRLLHLETTLYAPVASGPRAPLASTNVSVAFGGPAEVRRVELTYLLTNPQLLALEQNRLGDLRLEVQIRGFLPGAPGFAGCPDVTTYLSVAESRWRQQLESLGRSVGVETVVPFPEDDDPLRGIADFLREAQRQLAGNEIRAAMVHVRMALEGIKQQTSWPWPGKKDREQWTAGERWARIRATLEDQASGTVHLQGTRDYQYSRDEVETLIVMTAALLRIVPLKQASAPALPE
jgi:hypothetical protein